MNINLRVLQYFSVLAEELHFGRAAARLHISQPPLSQQIKSLEEGIGTRLFIRTQRHVELTAAGRTLKEQVPLIFEQVERAVELTRQTGRGHYGKLEIGMLSSLMGGLLPRALKRLHDEFPDVTWNLREMTPLAQLAALRERRLDVCFFRFPPSADPDLETVQLLREPMLMALPRDHRLARHAIVRLADAASEPFIFFDLATSRLAEFQRRCCIAAGFTPHVQQQVVEVQTLLSLVREGLGVSLLPASTRQFAHRDVVFRALADPTPETNLHAIYRRGDASPALGVFLKTLKGQVELDRVSVERFDTAD